MKYEINFEKGILIKSPCIMKIKDIDTSGYLIAPLKDHCDPYQGLWFRFEIPSPGEDKCYVQNYPGTYWDEGSSDYFFDFENYCKEFAIENLIEIFYFKQFFIKKEYSKAKDRLTPEEMSKIKSQYITWLEKFWFEDEGVELVTQNSEERDREAAQEALIGW